MTTNSTLAAAVTPSAASFASSSTYRKLKLCYSLVVAATALGGLLSLAEWIAPASHAFIDEKLLIPAAVLGVVGLGFLIAAIILWFRWVYVLHNDLRRLQSDYPLTPGQSLARTLIPVYNIWGFYNVFKLIGNFFSIWDQKRPGQPVTLASLVAGFYTLSVISNGFDRATLRDTSYYGGAQPWLDFTAAAVDLLYLLIIALLVRTVQRSLEAHAPAAQSAISE